MFAFDVKLSSTVRVDQPPPQASPPSDRPLSANLVDRMQRYWDATNYLTAAQFYLKDNPLLRRPLSTEDFKPRLLGHLGHIARAKFHLPPFELADHRKGHQCHRGHRPRPRRSAGNANAYLEGSYSSVRHAVTQDEAGMLQLFGDFSAPGGVPSHMSAHLPGSIHEGGELGYSLLHAYGG